MTTLVYPKTLIPNSNENVNDLNDNLNAIAQVVNGNLDAGNLANGAVTPQKIGTLPHVRVTNTANQSLPSTTAITLAFNSERWKQSVQHDNATNNSRLVCSVAGVYMITAHIELDAPNTTLQLLLKLNGTTTIGVAPGNLYANVSTTYRLNVNDYVEAIAFQNSGAARTILASANDSPEFMMVWLAP
jgi:hypothetical protein